MVVVDTSILHDLRLIAATRGTTMRFLVTHVLKAFIQAEKERMLTGETRMPFGYSPADMVAVARAATDDR
jgi:hypothetical protein